ncbi:MAG: hypothetical protein KKF68_00645 [Nanoarchaeota archaeon]|nr:hypothetical protein [Nanoarchaeota archaeon]
MAKVQSILGERDIRRIYDPREDSKLGFVYSDDPFEGLSRYKERNLVISPRKVTYPLSVQLPLIEDDYFKGGKGYGLRSTLGHFFEFFASFIYGGVTREQKDLNGVDDSSEKYEIINEPDVSCKERNCEREVKAVVTGSALKLTSDQFAKYFMLQLGGYSNRSPRITFEIFRHSFKDLIRGEKKRGRMSLEFLLSQFALSTRSLFSLPFSVMYQVHETSGKNLVTSKYVADKEQLMFRSWGDTARITSSGLNFLLAYPKKFLKEIGLNPKDYRIVKRKFPPGVVMWIGGEKVILPSFPVLRIRDKSPKKWAKEFKEKVLSKNLTVRNISDSLAESLLSFKGKDPRETSIEDVGPLFENLLEDKEKKDEDEVPF